MNSYQSCINLTKQQGIHYNLAAFYFLLPSTFKLVDSSDDISGFVLIWIKLLDLRHIRLQKVCLIQE